MNTRTAELFGVVTSLCYIYNTVKDSSFGFISTLARSFTTSIATEAAEKAAQAAAPILETTTEALKNTTANATSSFTFQEAFKYTADSFRETLNNLNANPEESQTFLGHAYNRITTAASWLYYGWGLVPDPAKMFIVLYCIYRFYSGRTSVKVDNHIHIPRQDPTENDPNSLQPRVIQQFFLKPEEVQHVAKILAAPQAIEGRIKIDELGIDMSKEDFMKFAEAILEKIRSNPKGDLNFSFA